MKRTHVRRSVLAVTLALALMAACLAAAAPAHAGGLPPHMLWWDVAAVTGASDSYADVAPTIDGGYVAAGITNDDGFGDAAGADVLVSKFKVDDTVPHIQWTRSWDNPTAHLADRAWAVRSDLLGNVIACGYSMSAGGVTNMLIVKWDAAGVFKWAQVYPADLAGGDSVAYDLICDGAANIYVTGSTETAPGVSSLVVRKLAATTGDTLWKAEYAGKPGSFNQGSAIVLDDIIGCYVVGYGERVANGDDDILLVCFDNAGGLYWARRIDSASHRNDEGTDIVIGGYTVTITGSLGDNVAGTHRRVALAKYSLGGTRRFLSTWTESGTAGCRPAAMAPDGYGGTAVAGSATRAGGVTHAFLVKWDKFGVRKWARVSYGDGNRRSFTDIVSAGKTFWVAGSTMTSAGHSDALLARYAPDGTRQWQSLWNGPGALDDGFNALCLGISSAAGVFAGGSSDAVASGRDAAAAKYTR